MYLLYYLLQDYDEVTLFHFGLFESEAAALEHKKSLMMESAANAEYNKGEQEKYYKQLHEKIDEISGLVREYLERNRKAIKKPYVYKTPTVDYLCGKYGNSYWGTEKRFLKKSREHWDRDRFWDEHLDLSKVDQEPEFIDDEYPPYPTPKITYMEDCFHVAEVPVLGR